MWSLSGVVIGPYEEILSSTITNWHNSESDREGDSLSGRSDNETLVLVLFLPKAKTENHMNIFQVAVAAMDLHRVDIVNETLAELRNAFDADSFRVRRLMVQSFRAYNVYYNILKFEINLNFFKIYTD